MSNVSRLQDFINGTNFIRSRMDAETLVISASGLCPLRGGYRPVLPPFSFDFMGVFVILVPREHKPCYWELGYAYKAVNLF